MDLYLLLVTVSATIFTLLCSTIFSFVYGKFRVQENQIIIASSSSSPPSPKSSLPRNCIHDVFPSFHGTDVRKSFLSHLLKEFGIKGINLFIDNEITRGELIGPELKKAIKGSRIAIVLLSKRYASSSWCLDELVEIMKCKEELGQTVIPVFYEVDPTDVKKQAGEFGKVFKETCKGKTKEVTRNWSGSLAKVATLAGYHSKNWDNEAKMVEDVATEVAKRLFNSTPPRDFEEFIGMEAHMENISPFLRTDLDEVRMIGIWGPAGIGKTTIARCLFNQLSATFQYSVFLMNVKAMYTPPVCSDDHNVKLLLQQKFLSQLLNQKEEDFKISHLGVAQERLNDKKVLVVLDDVDRLVQLEAMAKETRWFNNGSRIIVTTQDRKILKAHGIAHIYKVDFPSDCEAIQMFCMYAFGQKYPDDGFEDLVWEVTILAGKLPLGLRVMGSYFRGMPKEEWENTLPELRRCLDGEIERILMFSYNALSHEHKDLFLHIACFFNYEKMDKVVEHLSKRFSDVKQQLNVLAEKSLISLESEYVIMHDLLVQLGRDIVRKQSSEPGQRQFLLDKTETCEVLADDAGSRSVIGIRFYGEEIYVSERAFEGMSNLQFLKFEPERVGGGDVFHLFGGPRSLSRKLRLLDWKYFPMTCLDCIPNPELLVELIMVYSKLEKLWEGTKPLSNLKWVDLSYSKNLKDVSSLSTATTLQELKLNGCSSLVKLPSSIGIHLKRLDLTGCSSLVELPSSIGNATNLQFLSFHSCSSLVELPSSFGNAIKNLEELDFMDCSSLVGVPFSIGNATNLQLLDFRRCSSLAELPSSIGNAIRNLKELNFSDCSSLVGVPSTIGNATNLQHLDFRRCSSLVELPASIGNLHKLESLVLKECRKLEVLPVNINLKSLITLDLTDCSLLKSFPEISTNIRYMNLTGCSSLLELPSSIGKWNATNLQFLSFHSCSSLVELPSSIGNVTDLKHLNFRRCSSLLELPDSIGNLHKLESLILRECCKLEVLPVNMNLKSLTTLDLTDCSLMKKLPEISTNIEYMNLTGCSSLVELPSSIGNATNLQFLSFDRCSSLVELPSSIGNAIRNLEALDFSDCSSLVGVPSSIGNATNLLRLDFNRCSSLLELPASIENLHKLESLILKGCCKLEVLPVNISLKSLRKLDLTDCSLMKCFHEISTNIRYMYLTGTAIKEVPSSIRVWHNLTAPFMSNTEIQEIPPWIKRSSLLDRLVLKGCKELLSLPQLPDSLTYIDAENCESLERLDCSFINQEMELNFANCFKLNKEARDVIIQTSTNKVTILPPGNEMPNYFNYQAKGGSLVIELNERTFPSSMICKACILLVCKDQVEASEEEIMLYHWIKQNSINVECSPSYHILFPRLTEQLYIFEFEVDVTSDELCFDFGVDGDRWLIKECGVHYSNTR